LSEFLIHLPAQAQLGLSIIPILAMPFGLQPSTSNLSAMVLVGGTSYTLQIARLISCKRHRLIYRLFLTTLTVVVYAAFPVSITLP
jgi:hypothetical protein